MGQNVYYTCCTVWCRRAHILKKNRRGASLTGQVSRMPYWLTHSLTDNKQTQMRSRSIFWDKNLIFGFWFPHIQRQLDFSGWITKMNFALWEILYLAVAPLLKGRTLQRVFRIGPLFKDHESAKLLLHFSSIFATRRYFARGERSLSGKTSLEELLLSLPHENWNCCSGEIFQIMDSWIGKRICSISLSYLWSFFTLQK